jgi:hypothetical protein
MNFDINFIETDGKTLFFSAIKSYNVKLMEYLDNKFPLTIFLTDYKDNSCIFNIFKKDIKNLTKKDDIEKLKNLLRFILKRGFDINHQNSEGISFREKCKFHQIENLLNDVIEEIGMEIKDKNKENESENKIVKEKKEIINQKEKQKEKEENKSEMKKYEKDVNINKNNMIKNETFKLPNKVKVKSPNTEIKNEANNELKLNKINNFDFDIDVDDEFIKSESKKVFCNNQTNIKEERKNNFIKSQNHSTKKKVCAFLSKKRHNLILKEETLNVLRNNEIFKKYFITKN